MSFTYTVPVPAYQNTPTFGSGAVLAKSARINVAAGSGGAHNTAYPLGITLPKGAQIIGCGVVTSTAISGGTISAATIEVNATNAIVTGVNVFAAGGVWGPNTGGYVGNLTTNINKDYSLTYTLTLTGTGPATAGVITVTVLYVV